MSKLVLSIFAFFLSLFNVSPQTPINTVNSYVDCVKLPGSIVTQSYPAVCVTKNKQRFVQIIDEVISSKTDCKTDDECTLININDKNCCGSTGCEDKSTKNWEAVNHNWYTNVFQTTCQDGPCPMAQCNPNVIRESFVARCVSGTCTKLGGL